MLPLPKGIRSRFIDDINGLKMHILESGYTEKSNPCVLLLHGFPELAFSWRKIMIPLAKQGYHVIAPDLRGVGLTNSCDTSYNCNLDDFSMFNMAKDITSLLSHLKYFSNVTIVGHDFGSPLAAHCVLLEPKYFSSLTMMSAPVAGQYSKNKLNEDIYNELKRLIPAKKHYQHYFASPEANEDILNCSQGVESFLKGYYIFKSGDWKGNKPEPLKSWNAKELKKMPDYYIMPYNKTMPEVIEDFIKSSEATNPAWLNKDELSFYSSTYNKTGFQGGLNWYRSMLSYKPNDEIINSLNKTIDIPSCFIAGKQDWGIYQKPGDMEEMSNSLCSTMYGIHLVENAGHWVQQEAPLKVLSILLKFLKVSKK